MIDERGDRLERVDRKNRFEVLALRSGYSVAVI